MIFKTILVLCAIGENGTSGDHSCVEAKDPYHEVFPWDRNTATEGLPIQILCRPWSLNQTDFYGHVILWFHSLLLQIKPWTALLYSSWQYLFCTNSEFLVHILLGIVRFKIGSPCYNWCLSSVALLIHTWEQAPLMKVELGLNPTEDCAVSKSRVQQSATGSHCTLVQNAMTVVESLQLLLRNKSCVPWGILSGKFVEDCSLIC